MVIDADEETWVYYWAKWNGEFEAIKRKVLVPIHLAVQFSNGKITEEHVYYDGTDMNKAFKEIADRQAIEETEAE